MLVLLKIRAWECLGRLFKIYVLGKIDVLDKNQHPANFIAQADKALYLAKNNGKNRFEFSDYKKNIED